MAPGCFTTSTSSKESNQNGNKETMKQESTSALLEAMDPVVLNFETNSFNVESYTSSDESDSILIINSIPLPLSPPPPLPSDQVEDEDEDEDEEEDDQEDEEDDDDEEEDEDEKEVDAFEILEQTIIKQKRVAKLKNTDLRRKVLLKRTFDLVCEIMDRENGFNDDEPELIQAALRPKPASIKPKPENEQEKKTLVEEEEEIVSTSSSDLELELHDHSKMDESDEDEVETIEEDESIKAATTLVKLVDIDQPVIVDQESSAQVPRQIKRRSSSDDDQEEEIYDYEYSMNHLNDQQLNYKTNTTTHHPLDHESDLMNIYSDSHLVDSQQKSDMRSNHARNKNKKLRIN